MENTNETNNKKRNYVIIVICIILAIIFGILIGLVYSNRDVIFKSNTETNLTNNINNKDNNESIKSNDDVPQKEETSTNNNPKSDNQNVEYSTKDNLVIDELNSSMNKISAQKSGTNFTESAKSTFVTLVDFIFYDGTIKGVTFNELTDEGKQKVLELANKIDNTLEQKSPGYKDKISSTGGKLFNKASEIINDNATNMDNFAKEALGPENYQTLIDAANNLKEKGKDALNFVEDNGSKIINSTKDKLDEWYKNFKNNN